MKSINAIIIIATDKYDTLLQLIDFIKYQLKKLKQSTKKLVEMSKREFWYTILTKYCIDLYLNLCISLLYFSHGTKFKDYFQN